MSDIPPSLRSLLDAELAPGEVVRWAGQPDAALAFRRFAPALLTGLLCVLWTVAGGAFGALAQPLSDGVAPAGPGDALLAVLSLMLGFCLVSAPFNARFRARRTLYAVTDRRVIAMTDARRRTIRSVQPAALGPTTRRQRRDGRGSIRIGTRSPADGAGFKLSHIPDVVWVDHLIGGLRRT